MLAIVPARIKVRVSAFIVVGFLLVLTPWFFFESLQIRSLISGGILLLAFYIVWCFWPRLNLFIPSSLLGKLPHHDMQSFRLSFDDGPTPGLTDKILDLLLAANIKASFFVLMPKARANPGLLRRIINEGHEIGLHGEDHRHPFFRSSRELSESLMRAKTELEEIIKKRIIYYRPSHGWKTISLICAVKKTNLKLTPWDFGVWDTANPSTEILVQRLQLAARKQKKIILLHDGKNDDPKFPTHGKHLLEALDIWLAKPFLKDSGIRSFSVGSSIGIAVLVGLGIFGIKNINADNFWKVFLNQPILPLLGIAVGNIIATIFQGLRFYWLWPSSQVSAFKQIALQFLLNSGNIILPFRTSEVIRPLFLKRWNSKLPIKDLIFWTVIDKFLEALTFLPFLLLASWIFKFPALWIGIGFLTALGAIAVWCKKLGNFHPRALSLAVLSSFAMWFTIWGTFLFVVPNLSLALGIMSATTLGSMIPGGPASIGTFEAAFVWFLQTHQNLSVEGLLALAVAVHGSLILSTLLFGLPFIAVWGWPKRHADFVTRMKVPLRYKFTNIFLYIAGFLMIVLSFAVWIPNSRMPRRKGGSL